MRILAIDIGTGTQDIILLDSRLDFENSFKLVLPSPTMILRKKIQSATRAGRTLLLNGVTMGGGPCSWAIEDHLKKGLKVFALSQAARTINDDLEAVRDLGVEIISSAEAARLDPSVVSLTLGDVDIRSIEKAFGEFSVSLDSLDMITVGVFDHGNAPAGYSDRKFRFEYLEHRLEVSNNLSTFAFPAEEIPEEMTRLAAVRESLAACPVPIMVMDTAPAAVFGASLDPLSRKYPRKLIVNIGNFHTLAFRLGPIGIEGYFEHHTGMLDASLLEIFIRKLAEGSLTDEEIFSSQGHGARILAKDPLSLGAPSCPVIITGPRRSLLAGSDLDTHLAVPFGDMMTAGCVGLIASAAEIYPQFQEELTSALNRTGAGVAPWDLPN
jgi:uncharacterized protein (DUF1786 family)